MAEEKPEKKTVRRAPGTPSARVVFNCRFTAAIRKKFRQKRIELGLAYSRLGELFGANWSTVRKWETGPTESCELIYRPLIEAFLNGDYDRELASTGYQSHGRELVKAPVPHQVHQCMERMVSTYLLCMHEPYITREMLARMEEVSCQALTELVAGSRMQNRRRGLLGGHLTEDRDLEDEEEMWGE